MKKLLATTASLMALTAGPVWSQSFDDAGTDYTNATTETWTEDEADMLVDMPSTFACIIKNTRGDVVPNGSWEALIDENSCFGNVDDSQSGTSFAKVKLTSERASNTDPQEVIAYFDSVDGSRYIANVNMNAGPSENNPLGQWYFSFFGAGTEDSPIASSAATNYGFVNISESNGAVTIASADVFGNDATASVVKYDGNDVTFGGIVEDAGGDSFFAGKMNDTHYYRVRFTAGGFDAAAVLQDIENGNSTAALTKMASLTPDASSASCFEFGSEWNTVNRYSLYDATTGDEVEMQGGFSFETSDGVRGYMGNWGVWLDATSAVFTPTASTVTVSADVPGEDNAVDRTLEWSGGELYRITRDTEELSNGDKYIIYYHYDTTTNGFLDARATFDGTDFTITDLDGSNSGSYADLTSDSWLYSPKLRQWVFWSAGSTNVTFTREESVADEDDVLDGMVLKNVYGNAPAANLPISASTYASSGDSTINTGNADSVQYVLTTRTPGSGLEARALYVDANTNGVADSSESEVRFDFFLSTDSSKCSNPQTCLGQSTTYGGATADYSYTAPWPYQTVTLYDTSDTTNCGTPTATACTHYVWRYGASSWDNSILAYEGSDAVTISDPIPFSYTHAADKERNTGTFNFQSTDPNNPVSSSLNGSQYSVSASSFAGETFMLEYDGTSLHGLPWTSIGGSDYAHWAALINLKDGTELTSGNSTYVVKAREISQSLVPLANDTDCDSNGVKFTDLTTLGLGPADIPDITNESLYPRPSQSWSDAPADADLLCTVNHGDASACTAE